MKRDVFKKFRINSKPIGEIEPEEIFFDSKKIREIENDGIDARKLEKPISSATFLGLEILEIAGIFFFAIFTAFIIVAEGEDYKAQARENSSSILPLFAERGLIYSSDGEILARNDIYYDIFINSSELPVAEKLSELSIPQDLKEKLFEAKESGHSEFALFRGLSKGEVDGLGAYIANLAFFEIRQSAKRVHSTDQSFSHIVGYTGEVSYGKRVGKVGVEAFYDNILAGRDGSFVKRINSKGEVFSQELNREAIPGENITLSVNAELQRKIHKILRKYIDALKIDAGVVLIMDPKDGSIMSLVSIPNFDANLFELGISRENFEKLIIDPAKPLFNRAIAGEYPSGSTIKPIIAAAALEEELVSPDFLVYSAGSIQVPSAYNSDVLYEFKDWKAHGWADMRKAISDSVNVYFYTIAGGYKDQEGLGIKKIEEYLLKFGWGKALGIDLPGEGTGLIPSPKWKKENKNENWHIGDTYLTSIGQGDILATPLQVLAATAVFANNGTLFAPRLVSRIGNNDTNPVIIRKNFISDDNLKVVREGMLRSVTDGSSKFLASLPFSVAGKTGTAQTGRARNHAWFTGFAPYENPEVVITVLLEEGDDSNYTVRLAKEILDIAISTNNN